MNKEKTAVGLRKLVQDTVSDEEEVYRIGDLSREFDITLRTLRFYEDRRLIAPARSGATRLYSAEDRERLKMILLAKRVGFSLGEIQEILEVHDQSSLTEENSRKLLAKFEGQVSVLQKQRAEISEALEELSSTIAYLKSLN